MATQESNGKAFGIVGAVSAVVSIVFPIIALVKRSDYYSGFGGFFKDSSSLNVFPIVGAVLAVIALICSIIGLSKKDKALSVVGLIVSIISIGLVVYAFISLGSLENIYKISW